MLIVRVELLSAITGKRTELARMMICNTGEGTRTRGDYSVAALRGRDATALDAAQLLYHRQRRGASRTGRVLNHARLKEHVWNLVAKALRAMDYGDAA